MDGTDIGYYNMGARHNMGTEWMDGRNGTTWTDDMARHGKRNTWDIYSQSDMLSDRQTVGQTVSHTVRLMLIELW